MSVASFVASQRTEHGIPDALTCRELELSASWFYKWRDREPTARQRRQADLDAAVKASFADPSGNPGSYGSARVWGGPGRGAAGGCRSTRWLLRWPARVWWAAARSASDAR